MYQMKNVSAAIFYKNNSVLIAKRGNDKSLSSGYWEFPGGKQEEKETILKCLEREILEEFNVKCKARKIFLESIYNYDTIKLIPIFSDLLGNRIELKVHEDYKWVEINKLLEYNLAPADIPIAKKLIEIMERIDNLVPGQVIDNDELVSIFQCSPQGGMRRSISTNSLVIVSNHINSIYNDRWEKGEKILYYTGMGSEGGQSFDFMQNKTLYKSDSNDILVYLFEVFIEKKYTFRGKVALAKEFKEPFFEMQLDKYNRERKVCIFPVKIIDAKNHC
jgi:5-methylcytosine-specific restriction protein A